MAGGVDLLHFDLCVHIAVIHKVHISSFHLGDKENMNIYISVMSGYFQVPKKC